MFGIGTFFFIIILKNVSRLPEKKKLTKQQLSAFKSSDHHISLISEGSCDTEHYINGC